MSIKELESVRERRKREVRMFYDLILKGVRKEQAYARIAVAENVTVSSVRRDLILMGVRKNRRKSIKFPK